MARSALLIEEQETHITWNRDDLTAKIYVSDLTVMTRLDKLVDAENSEWKFEKEERAKDGRIYGKFYSCPIELISFRTRRMGKKLEPESNSTVEASEKDGVTEKNFDNAYF